MAGTVVAGTVGSAVAQETVSGLFSFVLGKQEEKASEEHNIERLQVAHNGLEYSLEITSNMPIIHKSLLRERKMMKRVYEECGDALNKHKLRVLEAEEAQQGVHSSFPKRITQALKSSISSVIIGLNRDGLNLKRDVARFELLAGSADKFVRRVSYGCSPSRDRFFSRLFRKVCQWKTLEYKMTKESNLDFSTLWVLPIRSDDFGVVVNIIFTTDFRAVAKKCYSMSLILRLSESMDIVETMRQSLKSLGPPFKSSAKEAAAELTQLLTEGCFSSYSVVPTYLIDEYTGASALLVQGRLKTSTMSELSSRYPEHVIFMHFDCYISASESDQQSCPSSRTTTEDWRILRLSVDLAPYLVRVGIIGPGRSYSAVEKIGGEENSINCSLHQAEEFIRTDVVNRFFHQRELMKYKITWNFTQGVIHYSVERELPWGLVMINEINKHGEKCASYFSEARQRQTQEAT